MVMIVTRMLKTLARKVRNVTRMVRIVPRMVIIATKMMPLPVPQVRKLWKKPDRFPTSSMR